jgi:ribosomal protein S18 acetylase RimI-like enzyme
VMRADLGIVRAGAGLARYRSVETHPDFRRRGLARAMVATAGAYALEHLGVRTLVIVADPGYHAIELYRSVGFSDVERQVQLSRV